MIPSKIFQVLRKGFSDDKSSSASSSSNKSTIIPEVCGFIKSRSPSYTAFRKVVPNERDSNTEGYHKIYVKDKGSKSIPKYKNVKLQKPEEFAVPAFTYAGERYTSLDKTINKTPKFDNFIQNLNDDPYAYEDLGCTPIDTRSDNPGNGDQVGKC